MPVGWMGLNYFHAQIPFRRSFGDTLAGFFESWWPSCYSAPPLDCPERSTIPLFCYWPLTKELIVTTFFHRLLSYTRDEPWFSPDLTSPGICLDVSCTFFWPRFFCGGRHRVGIAIFFFFRPPPFFRCIFRFFFLLFMVSFRIMTPFSAFSPRPNCPARFRGTVFTPIFCGLMLFRTTF